jgi:hypothetical protein
MIAAAAVETFDVVDVAPLLTLLGAAYMLSRGVAKAGTQHPFTGRESIGELRERIGMRSDASLSQRVEEPVYTGQPVAQAPQGYASAGGTEPVPPPHVGIRGPSDDPYHERPV